QIASFLYDELKLPKQYDRKTGELSTSEESLQKLLLKAKEDVQPVLRLLLDYRDKAKLLQFLEMQVDADGRARTSYNVSGTVNGRISSSKSVFGSGANLQQMPKRKDFRNLFIADEGYTLIKVDLSQAEVR